MLDGLTKKQQLILLGLAGLILAGLLVMIWRQSIGQASDDVIVIEQPKYQQRDILAKDIFIHITGAVKQAGVYQLKSGDRLVDAINLANGTSNLADLTTVNLAEKLKDGQKIDIPSKKITMPKLIQTQQSQVPTNQGSFVGGKININSASAKELCQIPGIGQSTAQRIIDYRQTKGSFTKLEDIKKVKRIGKSIFSKIKNKIII